MKSKKHREGKVKFKPFPYKDDEEIGMLVKDELYCGGYRVSTENASYSIEFIKIVEYMESNKEFTLKKYDNLEELILSVYKDDDVLTTVEDLKESTITGLDQNQEEVTFDLETMKAGIEAQGVWGWYDGEGVIHYWIGKDLPMEELIHFMAHEIGHGTGEMNKDDFEEEMRAEEFGYVATQAYKFAKQLKEDMAKG